MYKKVWSTCEVVVLLIKPIAFWRSRCRPRRWILTSIMITKAPRTRLIFYCQFKAGNPNNSTAYLERNYPGALHFAFYTRLCLQLFRPLEGPLREVSEHESERAENAYLIELEIIWFQSCTRLRKSVVMHMLLMLLSLSFFALQLKFTTDSRSQTLVWPRKN